MPDFEFEKEAGGVVAGVDEAAGGRGPGRWLRSGSDCGSESAGRAFDGA